jgi:Family of unknown function (DUF6519)/Right handed beta helix region
MGADLSRVRFDIRNDYAGVVLQQGRLLLDADWNELVAILDRMFRASIADLDSEGPAPGIAGVAVVPRTTPDAFKVTLAAGALSIGRGRMYVDGILAENHGLAPDAFEPMLAEEQGTADTPYLQQPYWPDPDALPATGSFLAYLDVWDREVTHIEAPDLVEQAVGVDTTSRRQTAWQVRLHSLGGAAVTCATPDADIPGWPAVIAPSGARLTVDTIAVDDDDDPCTLPPTGGYRGLENQTYRVEVHTGGAPGTATFKWSRDNGSVVTPVLEVLPGGTAMRPASFGRDAVLGFGDQDWVEILDDHRELDRVPGEMRLVEVHEEDGTLRFTPALPADLQLTTAQAAARHLRVRRWDQKGQVKSGAGGNLDNLEAPGSPGAVTVPSGAATQVVLEHGVVVSFSSTGAAFRTGDHWVFAARTADTSVERLVAAPPLGTHHHYARLGVLTFPGGETDCRTPWPPECECEGGEGCGDCTVCVTPESHASGALTIQMAVDEVKGAGGGTVCLEPGVYLLDESGVVVDQASSLRIRGQGLRTLLFAKRRGIQVTRSAFVTVESLTVITSGQDPAVDLVTTAAVTVESIAVLGLAQSDLPAPGIGLGGIALLTSLRDNVVVAPLGIAGGGDEKQPLLTAELDVRDNLLVCRDAGMHLAGRVGHLLGNRVTANTVVRAAEAGIRMLGAIAPGHGCTVADNSLVVGGSGIEVGTSGFVVSDNDVTGTSPTEEMKGDGISVREATFPSLRGTPRITDNQVRDVGGRGIGVLAPVANLVVTGNLVERALHGIVMEERVRADAVTVSDNRVVDVGSRAFDESDGVSGIQVLGARRASLESNVVYGVGQARQARGESTGIDVLACVESHVGANAVDRVGFPESGGRDVGIAVRALLRRVQVAGNTSRRQPVEADEDGPSEFHGLLVGADLETRERGVDRLKGYVVGVGEATFAIGPMAAYAVEFVPAAVTVDTNIVSGGGDRAAALIGVAGDVVCTGNQLHNRNDAPFPALRLVARTATVGQNRFRGGDPSAELDVDPKRLAVVGNLSTAHITVFGNLLNAPWDALNLNGV